MVREKDGVNEIATGNRNMFERASETERCDSKRDAMSTVTAASPLQRILESKMCDTRVTEVRCDMSI